MIASQASLNLDPFFDTAAPFILFVGIIFGCIVVPVILLKKVWWNLTNLPRPNRQLERYAKQQIREEKARSRAGNKANEDL